MAQEIVKDHHRELFEGFTGLEYPSEQPSDFSKMEGYGILFDKDGGTYKGQILDGKKHGKGVLFWPISHDKGVKFEEGTFLNDEESGLIKLVMKDGIILGG